MALLVPAVVAVGALLLLAERSTPPAASPAGQGKLHEPKSADMLDLDNVPGFGRSDSAAMRDETIASYEAWQRDVMRSGV
jgi:hypothetical protein